MSAIRDEAPGLCRGWLRSSGDAGGGDVRVDFGPVGE
jgi:hypothetical protein